MVLLLPHGFDGAGPEHSTCHIERFLQNVNSQAYDTLHGAYDNVTSQNVNFQVAQVTMPANYFHLLRRQMLRNYRKPLVLAAPKIGLKHPQAVSRLADFAEGTRFQPIYSNVFGSGKGIEKVIVCSGRLYFDIEAKFQQTPPPDR
jgi:probable 2-oxoglutarate dehydrogenase E1 component DHKTD1